MRMTRCLPSSCHATYSSRRFAGTDFVKTSSAGTVLLPELEVLGEEESFDGFAEEEEDEVVAADVVAADDVDRRSTGRMMAWQ